MSKNPEYITFVRDGKSVQIPNLDYIAETEAAKDSAKQKDISDKPAPKDDKTTVEAPSELPIEGYLNFDPNKGVTKDTRQPAKTLNKIAKELDDEKDIVNKLAETQGGSPAVEYSEPDVAEEKIDPLRLVKETANDLGIWDRAANIVAFSAAGVVDLVDAAMGDSSQSVGDNFSIAAKSITGDYSHEQYQQDLNKLWNNADYGTKLSLSLLSGITDGVISNSTEELKQKIYGEYIKTPSLLYSNMLSTMASTIATDIALTSATAGIGAPAAVVNIATKANTAIGTLKAIKALKTAGNAAAASNVAKPFIPFLKGAVDPKVMRFNGISSLHSGTQAYSNALGQADYFHDDTHEYKEAMKAATVNYGINMFGFGASNSIHHVADWYFKTKLPRPIWTQTVVGTGEAINNVTSTYASEKLMRIGQDESQQIETPFFMYVMGAAMGIYSGVKMTGDITSLSRDDVREAYADTYGNDILSRKLPQNEAIAMKKDFSNEIQSVVEKFWWAEEEKYKGKAMQLLRESPKMSTLKNSFETYSINKIDKEADEAYVAKYKAFANDRKELYENYSNLRNAKTIDDITNPEFKEKFKEVDISPEDIKNIKEGQQAALKTKIDSLKAERDSELAKIKVEIESTKDELSANEKLTIESDISKIKDDLVGQHKAALEKDIESLKVSRDENVKSLKADYKDLESKVEQKYIDKKSLLKSSYNDILEETKLKVAQGEAFVNSKKKDIDAPMDDELVSVLEDLDSKKADIATIEKEYVEELKNIVKSKKQEIDELRQERSTREKDISDDYSSKKAATEKHYGSKVEETTKTYATKKGEVKSDFAARKTEATEMRALKEKGIKEVYAAKEKAVRDEVSTPNSELLKAIKLKRQTKINEMLEADKLALAHSHDSGMIKRSPAYAVKNSYFKFREESEANTKVSFRDFVLNKRKENPKYLNFIYNFGEYFHDFEMNMKNKMEDSNFVTDVDLGIDADELRNMSHLYTNKDINFKDVPLIDIFKQLQQKRDVIGEINKAVEDRLNVQEMLRAELNIGDVSTNTLGRVSETLDNIITATISDETHAQVQYIKHLFRNIENVEDDIAEHIVRFSNDHIFDPSVNYEKVRSAMDNLNDYFYANQNKEGGDKIPKDVILELTADLSEKELTSMLNINMLFSRIYNDGELSALKQSVFQSGMLKAIFEDNITRNATDVATKLKNGSYTSDNIKVDIINDYLATSGNFYFPRQPNEKGMEVIRDRHFKHEDFDLDTDVTARRRVDSILREDPSLRMNASEELFDGLQKLSRKDSLLLQKEAIEQLKFHVFGRVKSKFTVNKDLNSYATDMKDAMRKINVIKSDKLEGLYSAIKNKDTVKIDEELAKVDITKINDPNLTLIIDKYKTDKTIPEVFYDMADIVSKEKRLRYNYNLHKLFSDLESQISAVHTQYGYSTYKYFNKADAGVSSFTNILTKYNLLGTLRIPTRLRDYLQAFNGGKYFVKDIWKSSGSFGLFKVTSKFIGDYGRVVVNKTPKFLDLDLKSSQFRPDISKIINESISVDVESKLKEYGLDKDNEKEVNERKLKDVSDVKVDKLFKATLFDTIFTKYIANNVQRSNISNFWSKSDDIFTSSFIERNVMPDIEVDNHTKEKWLALGKSFFSDGMTVTDLASRLWIGKASFDNFIKVTDKYSKQLKSIATAPNSSYHKIKDNSDFDAIDDYRVEITSHINRVVDETYKELELHKLSPSSQKTIIEALRSDYEADIYNPNNDRKRAKLAIILQSDKVKNDKNTEDEDAGMDTTLEAELGRKEFEDFIDDPGEDYVTAHISSYESKPYRTEPDISGYEKALSEYMYDIQDNVNYHYSKYNNAALINMSKKLGRTGSTSTRFLSFPFFAWKANKAVGFSEMQNIMLERKFSRTSAWMQATMATYLMTNLLMDDKDQETLQESVAYRKWVKPIAIDAPMFGMDAISSLLARGKDVGGLLTASLTTLGGTAEIGGQLVDAGWDAMMDRPDWKEEFLEDIDTKNRIVKNDFFKFTMRKDIKDIINSYGEDRFADMIGTVLNNYMGVYDPTLFDGAKMAEYTGILEDLFFNGINDDLERARYYNAYREVQKLAIEEKSKLRMEGKEQIGWDETRDIQAKEGEVKRAQGQNKN